MNEHDPEPVDGNFFRGLEVAIWIMVLFYAALGFALYQFGVI